MKKQLIAFVAGLLMASLLAFRYSPIPPKSSGFDADKGLARVEKKSGKYIFLECEPLAEYDVAFDVKASTGGAWQLSDYAETALKRATKIADNEKKSFDGIIIKGGQKADIAVKFK